MIGKKVVYIQIQILCVNVIRWMTAEIPEINWLFTKIRSTDYYVGIVTCSPRRNEKGISEKSTIFYMTLAIL